MTNQQTYATSVHASSEPELEHALRSTRHAAEAVETAIETADYLSGESYARRVLSNLAEVQRSSRTALRLSVQQQVAAGTIDVAQAADLTGESVSTIDAWTQRKLAA
jgi:SOS response regulatory protein OraA/RecX